MLWLGKTAKKRKFRATDQENVFMKVSSQKLKIHKEIWNKKNINIAKKKTGIFEIKLYKRRYVKYINKNAKIHSTYPHSDANSNTM